MLNAVWEAGVHFFAAEMKVRLAWMIDRPAADFFIQIEQARFVGNFLTRLGRYQTPRRRWWNRSLLIARTLTQEATGTD